VNPQFSNGFTFEQYATIALLVAISTVFLMIEKLRWLAAPAVVAAGCWAIPYYAHIVNYGPLHSAELDQLSDWARTQTSEQAMFVFPVSGHNLDQGVFRAKSLRSLYADWKAGGQANYFRDFALEWRRRWAELESGKLTADEWRARGVDYVVYEGPRGESLGQPQFENAKYRVYRLEARD
jgi:hypothetical protein